jgi:hypothetical protein
MKIQRSLFALAALLFATLHLGAQDVIHKNNGKTIDAKIIEIGTSEIKYKLFDQPDGPIYVDEKENIQKVVFQDGHTEFYGKPRIDATEAFEGQKKSAIKVGFLGPLVGYTNIIYERNIRPGRGWEAKAAIIGLGRRYDDDATGLLVTGAYKFYKKPTYYTADMKRSHLLQGAYIKPEVFLGYTSFIDNYDFNGNGVKEDHMTGGLLLNLGKQWIFDGDFVLDLSFGIGYGAGESVRSIYVNSDTGFAGQANLSIGWTLK